MKENKQKIGNKGFSLIELIIVMAIMAVLVGALAPQYLKYVERARRSNDIQAAATIGRAAQIALADMNVADLDLTEDDSFTQDEINGTSGTDLQKKLKDTLDTVNPPESTGFEDFTIEVDVTSGIPNVTVSATNTAGSLELFPEVDPGFKNGDKAPE